MHLPNGTESLKSFEERAFTQHMLYDLPFPVLGTALILGLITWLMHGNVPGPYIAAWLVFATLTVVARQLIERRMKTLNARGEGHAQTLRVLGWMALPIGAISGAFACLYFDANRPITLVILGTYMAAVIVGAVVQLSIHLASFFMLALAAHLPYLYLLIQSDGADHLMVAVINLMFLVVVFSYAFAANKMQREAIRLRYENQNLINDLEARKADAENASRTKSLFLAGVGHDLKQPIRAIGMYTGFLRHSASNHTTPPQVIAQTAEKIESAVGAIHNQITRLLELSRLESGAMPLHLEWLDIDDILQPTRQLLTHQAHADGIQLRFALGHPRPVLADRRMLESILANFLSNAIKHANSRVYIGTRLRTGYPSGQQLCIEVRDDGSGIQAHQLPLLFDAYRSFDDRQASESHGLGLAIAKAQASYLGCEIAVNSAPGCGATFTLCGLRTAPAQHDQHRAATPT
ncbi:MAG: HAMP domain-containing sensor histidine kinase [Hydrogenophaga sp.]